jgi:hypothetical protein
MEEEMNLAKKNVCCGNIVKERGERREERAKVFVCELFFILCRIRVKSKDQRFYSVNFSLFFVSFALIRGQIF